MGKNGKHVSKSIKGSYSHNSNPKAHNSDARRLELLENIQINRLTKIVDQLKDSLSYYKPTVVKIISKNGIHY